MQIVIDKSYLQGTPTETVRRLCEEHTVLFTETLLYEILTTTESIRRACFAKLPARENSIVLIPCVGPLLRYEIEHRQAASLIDHRLPFTGTFYHPPHAEETLVQWRQEVESAVERFHLVATEVVVWCPQLRELSGNALRTACEDLKRQTGVDADAVRRIYQSLEGLEGFPPAAVLETSWVLFRWIQALLLFALDHVVACGQQLTGDVRHAHADMLYSA